jgi:hypothetical protein
MANLKPGGWLEVVDFEAWGSTDDNTLPADSSFNRWQHELNSASSRTGRIMNVAPLIKDMVVAAGFQAVEEEIYKVCPSPYDEVDLTYKPAVSPLALAQGQAAKRACYVHELEFDRGRSSLQFGTVHSRPWLAKGRSRGADGWSSNRYQEHKISFVHPPVSQHFFESSFRASWLTVWPRHNVIGRKAL